MNLNIYDLIQYEVYKLFSPLENARHVKCIQELYFLIRKIMDAGNFLFALHLQLTISVGPNLRATLPNLKPTEIFIRLPQE